MAQRRSAASRRHHGPRRAPAPAANLDGAIARPERAPGWSLKAAVAGLAWASITAAVVVTPLVVDPQGRDSFRLPKEAFVVANGIILIVAGVLAIIFGATPRWRALLHDRVNQLIAAIVAWTVIATAASTNRVISRNALVYVIALAAFTAAVYWLGRGARLRVVMLMFIAAIPNCVLYVLQESRVWNPFATEEQIQKAWFARHIFSSALIGNPDDIGGYLLPIAIVAAALVVIAPTRAQRALSIAAAVLFGGTLVATQSWGAIGAYAAALSMLFALTMQRPARAILLAALIGIGLVVAYPTFRARLTTIMSTFAARKMDPYAIDLALSNRLTPFAAAVGMTRDHPFTGVGPGCFGWHYYGYKVMFENAHPELRKSAAAYFNWAETHNDHLQTLAVSGVPGYALFVCAIVVIASCSSRRRQSVSDHHDARLEFSRLVGLPIAVAFGLHSLVQFPLELASVMPQLLFTGALCVAWRSSGPS